MANQRLSKMHIPQPKVRAILFQTCFCCQMRDFTDSWSPANGLTISSSWHGVSNDLVEAMTPSTFVTQPTTSYLERQELWDDCIRSVQHIADIHWAPCDNIIVSAAKSLSESELPNKRTSELTFGLYLGWRADAEFYIS